VAFAERLEKATVGVEAGFMTTKHCMEKVAERPQ